MADRHASFFGPVLPTADHATEAFSAEELVQIRARRLAVDVPRAKCAAWPETRRFQTLYPANPMPSTTDRLVAPPTRSCRT